MKVQDKRTLTLLRVLHYPFNLVFKSRREENLVASVIDIELVEESLVLQNHMLKEGKKLKAMEKLQHTTLLC